MKKRLLFILLLMSFGTVGLTQSFKPLGPQNHSNFEILYASLVDDDLYGIWKIENLSGDSNRLVLGIWNGSYWQPIAPFFANKNATFNSMIKYHDNLFIGGDFTAYIGMQKLKGVLVFDGQKLFGPFVLNQNQLVVKVNCFEVYKDMLLAGGRFEGPNDDCYLFPFDEKGLLQGPKHYFDVFDGQITALKSMGSDSALLISGEFTSVKNVKGLGHLVSTTDTINWKAEVKGVIAPFQTLLLHNDTLILQTEDSLFIIPDKRTLIPLHKNLNKQKQQFKDVVIYKGQLLAAGIFNLNNQSNVKLMTYSVLHGWIPWPLQGVFQQIEYLSSNNNKLFVKGVSTPPRSLNGLFEFIPSRYELKGRIYVDADNNCKFGEFDPVAGNLVVRVGGGKRNYYFKTDEEGNFSTFLPQGKFTFDIPGLKYLEPKNCTNYTWDVEIGPGPGKDSYNLALKRTELVKDVVVNWVPVNAGRATLGKKKSYLLKVGNRGTKTVNNFDLEVALNASKINFSSNPPFSEKDTLKGKWSIDELLPGENQVFKVTVEMPTESTNDNFTFKVNTFGVDDANPSDNSLEFTEAVSTESTPLIPRYKILYPTPTQENEMSFIDPEYGQLHYVIHFQNNGSEIINNVYVVDTIDLNLDLAYIQETISSHSYTTELIQLDKHDDRGILLWRFDNINLDPNPAQDPEAPNTAGFIGFKIQLNSGTELGTQIPNHALVVMDQIDRGVTNTVWCEVKKTNNITSPKNNLAAHVFPNPFTSTLNIEAAFKMEEINIWDINGRLLETKKVTENQIDLQLNQLPQGMYLLEIKGNDQLIRKKIQKF